MAININDPNMKKVMDYVSVRIKEQHLQGIDLFRAVEATQPELIETGNQKLTAVDRIRLKIQKLHSEKEKLVIGDINKIKTNKQTGRHKS